MSRLKTIPDSVRRAAVSAAALVFAVVTFAGCNGGTVDRHALTNDSASIDSMACEGALLAHDIALRKTTVYFAREQANVLRIQASNLAHALATRPAEPEIRERVRAKARESSRLSQAFQELHASPSDAQIAASIEGQLKKLGGCE